MQLWAFTSSSGYVSSRSVKQSTFPDVLCRLRELAAKYQPGRQLDENSPLCIYYFPHNVVKLVGSAELQLTVRAEINFSKIGSCAERYGCLGVAAL